MIPARLSSLLSVPTILLLCQQSLEGASIPVGSFACNGRRAGLTSRGRAASFGKGPQAPRRSGVNPFRFDPLARWLVSGDPGGTNGVSRRTFFKVLGCLVLVVPPALEIYSRLGSKEADFQDDLFPQPPLGSWDDVKHATMVFHGSGGQDQFTDKLIQNLKRLDNKSKYSNIVEWRKYSSDILQASFNGQRIGRYAANQLLQRARNLESVHVIGISVGAFAADAVCDQVKASLKDSVDVQLTLLDPFTQRGILDFGYGARKYGESADYFEQYLNTDDPVPSTNLPLEKSVCYDITAIRPVEVSFGHDWPVAYYGRQKNIGMVPPAERLPRGTIIRVEQ
jgi:Lipase